VFGIWWMGRGDATVPVTTGEPAAAPASEWAPVRARVPVRGRVPVVAGPVAAGPAPPTTLFAPRREERFALEAVAVQWDDSCGDATRPLEIETVGDALEDVDLDLTNRLPERGQIVDFAQFYTAGDAYLQLTAEWSYDRPARYKVTLLRFDDARFSNPRSLSVGVNEWIDAAELRATLARIDGELERDGAVRGSRSVVLASYLPSLAEPSVLAEEAGYVVEMRNGRPMRYHGLGVACHTRGEAAICSCVDHEAGEGAHDDH
jgi:hypothetical protein